MTSNQQSNARLVLRVAARGASGARPEEFLYLACLHEGTGVDEPDFLAVVDAEDGRIVHETPMPNVGDELHHFGWNRCSSACHGPDRSHLIVPGFRSSRIHVAQRRRRPAAAADREGDRARGARREDRANAAAHRPLHAGRQHRHQHARRRRRQRRRRLRGARRARRSRSRAAGRTAADGRRSTTTSGTSRARTCSSRRSSASPTPTRTGFDLDDVAAGRYGSRLHFWNLAERRLEQTLDLGEAGLVPLEVRWLHDPDADAGLRRRDAVEHDVALPPRQRRLRGRAGDRGRRASSSRAGRSRRRARA